MALRKQQVTDEQVQALFPDKHASTNTETNEPAMPRIERVRSMSPTLFRTPTIPITNQIKGLKDISVLEVFDNKEFSHARDFKSIETDLEE